MADRLPNFSSLHQLRRSWMPLLSARSFTLRPLPFFDKKPDRRHQILDGDVDILFPENLRDPISVTPEASPVTSQQSSLFSFPAAPLHQLQAQIRHKPDPPTGYPNYFVLCLSSPLLRAER
jgi:hypothetical protein